MKLSVIFGIVHMSMGILIKGLNAIYFKDMPTLFTEVITGLIILLGLFGWMDVLIIGKWLTPIDIENDQPYVPYRTKIHIADTKPRPGEPADPSS